MIPVTLFEILQRRQFTYPPLSTISYTILVTRW